MTDNTPITKQQAEAEIILLEMETLALAQRHTVAEMKLQYYKRLLSNFEKLEAE